MTCSGFDDCVATLFAAGLPAPPIPPELAAHIVHRGKWNWSTIANEEEELGHPYNLVGYVDAVREHDTQDFVTLRHCGHGANSWALAFFLVHRPLYLFVHQAFGGAYMDDERSAQAIQAAYRLSAELADAVHDAVDAGRIGPTERLFVVACDFYGSWWTREAVTPEKSGATLATLLDALDYVRGL